MRDLELTRVAGHVVDVLGVLGYSSEQIVAVAKLVEQHAGLCDKYEEETRRGSAGLVRMPN
jgi:hypothetical protein